MIVYSLIIVSIKEAERIELIEKEQTSQVITGFMKNWMDRSNGHMDILRSHALRIRRGRGTEEGMKLSQITHTGGGIQV